MYQVADKILTCLLKEMVIGHHGECGVTVPRIVMAAPAPVSVRVPTPLHLEQEPIAWVVQTKWWNATHTYAKVCLLLV